MTRSPIQRLVLPCILLCYIGTAALGADTERFSLAGQVVNSVSGEPISDAAVQVTGTEPPFATVTNGQGVFRVDGLQAGSYMVEARKPGFQPFTGASYTVVAVGSSETVVRQQLEPLSTIAGRVVDGNGQPLEGLTVELLGSSVAMGRQTFTMLRASTTNKGGSYQFTELAPGEWYLRAYGAIGSLVVPVTYCGGSLNIRNAARLHVEASKTESADLTVTTQRSYSITGHLLNLTTASSRLTFTLVDSEGNELRAIASVDAQTGQFHIRSVPKGTYRVRVSGASNGSVWQGEATVPVGGANVPAISIALQRRVRITVDVLRAATSVPAGLSLQQVAAFDPLVVQMKAENTESVEVLVADNVPAGLYDVHASCGQGFPASLDAGSTDVLAASQLVVGAEAIHLVLACGSAAGTVTGTVAGADAQRRPGVLLLPASGRSEPTLVRTGEDGSFSMSVAPGVYYALTVPDPDALAYRDAEFLTGMPVVVPQGGSVPVQLPAPVLAETR